MAKNTVAIIPARSGSKGIQQKNIRQIAGKPLIAWTIVTALRCPSLDRVITSTDDPDIAEIARSWGAEVPFLRPTELAQDDTPDFPVYEHTLQYLLKEQSYSPNIVAWLRPTSPLRKPCDVENALKLLIETGADCVRTVSIASHHPYWMKRFDEGRLIPFLDGFDEALYCRRQMLPPVYSLNGAVDIIRCKPANTRRSLFSGDMRGYLMPPERSFDLDTELDFIIAENLLQRGME